MMDQPTLLNTEEAARFLRVSPRTLERYRVTGEGPRYRKRDGRLHDAPALKGGGGLTTDKALADERETITLMRTGQRRGKAPMRGWMVDRHLRKGPLTAGQKEAVRLILSEKDRTVGVQGYAGTGKTTMLNRTRTLAEKKGWRLVGLAPSASAAQTLAAESGIESETLQRFLARNTGVTEGRLTRKGAKALRGAFAKTALVVDEGSLASTVQARDLLRIARELRIPKLVLVGDSKQLDAVDAGKPFAQLQAAGMKTAVMDEIMRQRDPELKAAVQASLAGEIGKAFEKLGAHVAEVIHRPRFPGSHSGYGDRGNGSQPSAVDDAEGHCTSRSAERGIGRSWSPMTETRCGSGWKRSPANGSRPLRRSSRRKRNPGKPRGMLIMARAGRKRRQRYGSRIRHQSYKWRRSARRNRSSTIWDCEGVLI